MQIISASNTFPDGVDETPLLATKFGEKRKDKKNKKTEPITWCLDILRRDVLGESVLILASRYGKSNTSTAKINNLFFKTSRQRVRNQLQIWIMIKKQLKFQYFNQYIL